MIINLEKLKEAGEVITGKEVIGFRDFQGEENDINCEIEVAAQKSGEMYHFNVIVRGTFETFCHKCLEPVKYGLETSFDVVVQRGGVRKSFDTPAGAEEYIYLSMNEHEVSLDPQIYENLIVSIPMQIICSENCRGLCAECGVNLNVEKCGCIQDGDPGWDNLRNLKDKFSQ